MGFERPSIEHEPREPLKIEGPAVELLLDPAQAAEAWPAKVVENRGWQEQVESRRNLIDSLEKVSAAIPKTDTPIEQALQEGQVSATDVATMYSALSKELSQHPEYERLALYLPFEYLPPSGFRTENFSLQQSVDEFRTIYRTTWENLLRFQDVRQNFVDGDVLEVESRTDDLPRVVKAAHLIPKLIERGIFDSTEVAHLYESTSDPILRQSIADTLPTLVERRLLTPESRARLEKLGDPVIDQALREGAETLPPEREPRTAEQLTVPNVQHELATREAEIDRLTFSEVTPKRAAWLKQERRRVLREELSDDLSANWSEVGAGQFPEFTAAEVPTEAQRVGLAALRKTLEKKVALDPAAGAAMFAQLADAYETLWTSTDLGVKRELAITDRRMHAAGVLSAAQLERHGLAVPHLTGSQLEQIDGLSPEIHELEEQLTASLENPALRDRIYPVMPIFGSRLKGYGLAGADLDAAIFLRPQAQVDNRPVIHQALAESFQLEKYGGQLSEFWLEAQGEELAVHDFDSSETSLGESDWTHVLLNSTWVGEPEAMQELRHKLLVPYLKNPNRRLRARHLENMERDALQYRLLHRGYMETALPAGGLATKRGQRLESQSAFWDSGYRRAATQLFAKRVFLPTLTA